MALQRGRAVRVPGDFAAIAVGDDLTAVTAVDFRAGEIFHIVA